MTTTSRVPDLAKCQDHVWDLAEVVHPRGALPYQTWIAKLLERYSIPKPTGPNRALSYDYLMLLWVSLANTEVAKCNKLRELYNAAVASGHIKEEATDE
jgi:hypothetical protein